MFNKFTIVCICFALILGVIGCAGQEARKVGEVKRFPLDSIEGVLSRSDIEVDRRVSSDGKGSLRIIANEPRGVRLFELGDIDVENGRLIYQAKLRTENVDGKVYLEMVCHFPGSGEFFSRGLQNPITGTVNWTTEETPFFLRKGQNPDNVKLNLIIDGTGIVWIDDIRLLKWTAK